MGGVERGECLGGMEETYYGWSGEEDKIRGRGE